MASNKAVPGRRIFVAAMRIAVWSLPFCAFSGGVYAQTPESRYVMSSGYALVQTPALHLSQKGFQLQAGLRLRPWMVTGFDFSQTTGLGRIDATELQPTLQRQIGGAVAQYQAAGLLPAGYQFRLPSQTQSSSFSFGPQMTLRLPRRVTLLGNPAAGALRERTTPRPSDAFQAAIVQQAMPSRTKLDWTPFFGGTAGVDASLFKHIGVKAQVDALRSHPFNDLLARGNWSYRYTLGITLKARPVREASVR